MKILFFADPTLIHTQRWVKYFIGRKHEIHIITHKEERISGANIHVLKYVSNKFLYFLNLPQINNIIKKISPDIIHSHYVTNNGILGCFFKGDKPFVVTAWGSDIFLESNGLIRKLITRKVLKSATLITADSDTLCREISRLTEDKGRIFNIQWGVDLREIEATKSISAIKAQYNIPDDHKVVMSLRDIKPLYNIEVFIKSISIILKKYPNVVFIIKYMTMTYLEKLKNLASQLKVLENCRFIGFINRDELINLYYISDVSVSIPMSDSTPITLLESMFAGSIPILSNLPSNLEWVQNGVNGIVINFIEEGQLANAVLDVFSNRYNVKQMQLHNNKIVSLHASYEENMKKMENLYIKIGSDKYL